MGATPIQPDAVMPAPGGSILDLLDQADDLEPKYPPWLYRTDRDTGERVLNPPPRPDAGRFKDWISGDATLYSELLLRFQRDLAMYRRWSWGVGSSWNPDLDSAYITDEVAIQVNKIAAMIAGTPHSVSYTWRTKKEREWAQAMEALDLWFLDKWDIFHRAEGNSALKHDLVWSSLIYGRQVVQVGCDLSDAGFPWIVTVHDPACVFPIWGKGKQGMLRCSIRYTTTIADILDEYDADGYEGLEEELANTDKRSGKRNDYRLDYTEERTVSECLTRWHHYVDVDGHPILETDHEYGVVPLIYNLAPGEMGSASTPLTGRREGLTRRDIKMGYMGLDTSKARQRDQVEKGQSFFHAIRNAIYQKERLLGYHMTAAEQGTNPPTFITNPYKQMPAAFDFGPGGRNELKPGQQATPVFTSPRPLDSQPVLQSIQSDIERGMLPGNVFGQVGDNNVSGFANDSLIAAAKDVIHPYEKLTEDTLTDVLALKNLLFYNFGHLTDGLVNGELVIPRQNRNHLGGMHGTPAKPPSWAMPILQKMMELTSRSMQPQQAPQTTIPGGPGMIGSDVPGAPPQWRSPQAQSMIGMPGYVDPAWTMGESLPMEDAPEFVITRQIIDAISTRPTLKLNALGLQSRTVLMNYLDIATRGNLMSRGTAMDQIPEIVDSLAEWRAILAEQAETNPDSLAMIGYPRALLESGDVDAWFTYWATILFPKMIGNMQGLAGLGGQSQGPPPQGAPSPNPTQIQGQSAAMMGAPPGANGAPVGRPPG